VTRDDLLGLAARLLVITAAAIAFGWWQWSVAAGLAFGLGLWAIVVLGPGEGT